MIELKKLSPNDGDDIYAMLQAIPANENGFINSCNGLSFEEYKEWLLKNDDMAKGIGLEEWHVPQNTYWLYVDGEPVGMGKLRIRLTEKLKADGGHCGYGIIPSRRGNGYGRLFLKLLTEEAGKLGMESILLTINNDNIASIKVAMSNNGFIEKVSGEKHYIWINCIPNITPHKTRCL